MVKCAVVGNAKSIFNRKQGKYIDSFDVVVRCNKGVPTKKKEEWIGSKTDVVFFAGGWTKRNRITQENLRVKYGRKVIAYTLDEDSSFFKNKKVVLADYKRFWDLCFEVYGQRKGHPHPSTGLFAIDWAIRQGHEVEIFGFDFFKTIDWTGKTDVNERVSPAHNFKIEEKFFNKLKEVIMSSKQVKDIKNKAILEPKTTKSIKPAVKVKCKACGYGENVNRTRCYNCNSEL